MTDITVAFRPFFRQSHISKAAREHPFIGMPIPGEETAPVRSHSYFNNDPFIKTKRRREDQSNYADGSNLSPCRQQGDGCGERLVLDKDRKIWRCGECGGVFSDVQPLDQPVVVVETPSPPSAKLMNRVSSTASSATSDEGERKKKSKKTNCSCGRHAAHVWQLNAFTLFILFLVLFLVLLSFTRAPK